VGVSRDWTFGTPSLIDPIHKAVQFPRAFSQELNEGMKSIDAIQ
jgi:hypothetical protein